MVSSLALRLLAVLIQPPTIIPPVAFVDVTVIPMDRDGRLPHQTVVVDRGRISALGPTGEVAIPTGATVVPGQGRFLIPGLFDMHAHLQSDGRLPDSLAPDELVLFLANGVTTVRLMIGTPEHLVLRRELRAGRIQGPDLVIGSPQLAGKAFGDPFNGYAVATPAEAVAAVRRAKADGYDFIKVTFFISRAAYEAIVATAAEVGLRVVGHVDPEVGLARALETGQQIEHLDGFPEALFPDSDRERRSVSGVGVWQARAWETLDQLDLSRIDSVARSAATRGLFVTPTLTFLRTAFGDGQTDAEIAARPDFRFFPEYLKTEMAGPRAAFWKHPPDASRRRRYVEVRNRVTAALARAGARIMAGSDAPEWFLGNGWTLHRELASLVAAGLTPYQALAAATVTPAEWIGAAADRGTVTVGKRADLVLLDADPLVSITATERIAGVVAGGRWLPGDSLPSLLDRVAARLGGARPDR